MSAQQLNLALSLADDTLFDNFLTSHSSTRRQVIETLKRQFEVEPPSSTTGNIFLWGALGSGLTHLLQASCHEAVSGGQSIQYLPLEAMANYPAQDVLQGLCFIYLMR